MSEGERPIPPIGTTEEEYYYPPSMEVEQTENPWREVMPGQWQYHVIDGIRKGILPFVEREKGNRWKVGVILPSSNRKIIEDNIYDDFLEAKKIAEGLLNLEQEAEDQ